MTETDQNDDPKRKAVTVWFLHAKDAHSNEVISRAFYESQTMNTCKEHLCSDGKSRYLYEVENYSVALRFYKSQRHLSASFEIYRTQDNGKPGKFIFATPAKPTLKSIKAKSDHRKR